MTGEKDTLVKISGTAVVPFRQRGGAIAPLMGEVVDITLAQSIDRPFNVVIVLPTDQLKRFREISTGGIASEDSSDGAQISRTIKSFMTSGRMPISFVPNAVLGKENIDVREVPTISLGEDLESIVKNQFQGIQTIDEGTDIAWQGPNRMLITDKPFTIEASANVVQFPQQVQPKEISSSLIGSGNTTSQHDAELITNPYLKKVA